MVAVQIRSYCLKSMMAAFILLQTTSFFEAACQAKNWNYYLRVYFTDKGTQDVNDFNPSDLLSERAIKRREKNNIIVPDLRDIPVYPVYTGNIESLGYKLHCTSRWMNTALFKSEYEPDLEEIRELSWVKDARIVWHPDSKGQKNDKLDFQLTQEDPLSWSQPVVMLSGDKVHNSGINGKGVLIAVLDGGFLNADNITCLTDLRKRNGIKGTYNFVDMSDFVYSFHNHGTAVLSVLAGYLPRLIDGTARGADYWLLRTENTSSEFPAEEDFWAAGAEFADSIGADIISSSLGYSTFDDPEMDYKYSDLDGNSTFITRIADIAASKGILVVNSAGNERNKNWKYIIAPADGDSVLAVGAVDPFGNISGFSSAGPSYDRQVKPDVVSQGVSVPVQVQTISVDRSSGTSFSCPVISGMCACIIQAVPDARNTEIISMLHSVADRSLMPDSLYGYGIPNIAKAVNLLQDTYVLKPESTSIVFPNPFTDRLNIIFREIPGNLTVEIYDINGKMVSKREFADFISRIYTIDGLHDLGNGIYFIRLSCPEGTYIQRIIKTGHPL